MSVITLAVYAAFFLVLWFVLIRPTSKRNRAMRQDQSSATVGSQVMLTSGIFGRVSSVDDDSAKIGVEIAPGVTIQVARVAIATVTPEKTEDDDHAGESADMVDEVVETD